MFHYVTAPQCSVMWDVRAERELEGILMYTEYVELRQRPNVY